MVVVCTILPIPAVLVAFGIDGPDRWLRQIHFGVKSLSAVVEPLFTQMLVLVVELVLAVGQE